MKKLFFLFLILFCSSVFGLYKINEMADLNYLGDGQAKFTFHSEPKYYRENGVLTDINAEYEKIEGGFFDWKVTKGLYTLKVKEDGTFRIIHAGDKITLKLLGLGFYNKDTKNYIIKSNLNFSNPTVEKNRITWSLPLDSTYSVFYENGRLRDVVIISQQAKTWLKNNRPQDWNFSNTFVGLIYYVDLNKVSTIDVNGQDINGDFETEGAVKFNQNGRLVHTIIPAHAYTSDLNHFDLNHDMTMWNKRKIYKHSENIYIEVTKAKSLWSANSNLIFNATISFDINLSTDDAEESNTGSVNTSGVGITLTSVDWGAGMRFQGTEVPQGSTIIYAHITSCGGQNCGIGTSRCESEVYGEDEDNTTTFTTLGNPNNDISNRTKTTASYQWLDTTSYLPNFSCGGHDWNTTEIVQELVDRPSFAENTMSFLIDVTFIGKNKNHGFNTIESGSNIPQLEITYEATEDYSFALNLPSSGCTQGKGCTTGGCSACERAWFDYNGTINCGSTETKIEPEGQDWNATPFWIIDNQSTTPNDFKLSIDLNQNTPSGVTLKATESGKIFWNYYPNCTYGLGIDCIVLDDTNKYITRINYSQNTDDYNLFLWTDYTSGCAIGQHNREATFYSYGVGT